MLSGIYHCGYIISIDKDVEQAITIFKNLDSDDLRSLFRILGLAHQTVQNKYNGPVKAYADDLIRAWIQGKDRVLELKDYPGGPTWENLKKALLKNGHKGTAAKI